MKREKKRERFPSFFSRTPSQYFCSATQYPFVLQNDRGTSAWRVLPSYVAKLEKVQRIFVDLTNSFSSLEWPKITDLLSCT